MRTRLDEIIAEEAAKTNWTKLDKESLFERIAERAFRHGVEQATPKYAPEQWDIPSIQPAPAEEKCPTCGGAPHAYPPMLDRRKGERRGSAECTFTEASGMRVYHRCVEGYCIHEPDRRSGKDRRK